MRFKPLPAEVATWETTLTEIAKDYVKGIATVEPSQLEETCRYCDLSTLCRIKMAGQFPNVDAL